jgi:hypothetical protein
MHAIAMKAIGFQLNSRSFLTSGPNFIVTRANSKNFNPWLIRVARQKMKIFMSKMPGDIENIL